MYAGVRGSVGSVSENGSVSVGVNEAMDMEAEFESEVESGLSNERKGLEKECEQKNSVDIYEAFQILPEVKNVLLACQTAPDRTCHKAVQSLIEKLKTAREMLRSLPGVRRSAAEQQADFLHLRRAIRRKQELVQRYRLELAEKERSITDVTGAASSGDSVDTGSNSEHS